MLNEKIDFLIQKARTVSGIPSGAYEVFCDNIGDLLTHQVETYGSKPWIIFYSDETGRHEYSYREFYELVCKTGNFLINQGIRNGDRIATVAFNHYDTVIQYFAAWLIGAVVVPINVGEDDKRISFILQNSQTKLAFVRDAFIERMEKIRTECPGMTSIIRVGSEHPLTSSNEQLQPPKNYPDFHSSVQEQGKKLQSFPVISPEAEALIVYTSGTTGMPKGVVLTHYNLLVDAKAIADWHGMTADQRMMCVLPIHHVNGTVVTLLTPLYYGGSVVLNQKFHTHRFFEQIASDKIHVVSVVPTLLQFLLHDHREITQYDLRHFRYIICGAGPLTVELAITFEQIFHLPIVHGYGLSETTCYSCLLPPDLPPDEHNRWLQEYGFPSIGVPIPINEMAIHDDDGNDLPEGTKGEIVIRGHNVMKEYLANPEANEKAFRHGWFRSGDEGFYKNDANGKKFFFITGRIKELIIRGGMNISPFEIDEILMNIPGVQTGLAVGFDNVWYGEEVGAYVQLKSGVKLSEKDILTACRKNISFQKCPKVVVFGDQIPVTSTGKYQRTKLKPHFSQWKSVQFTENKHPAQV